MIRLNAVRDKIVLNAFRHQRMDHIPGEAGDIVGSIVLNAFRHQRMDHTPHLCTTLDTGMCSTPFGINEWITFRQPFGKVHSRMCSTPFGINEWITRGVPLVLGTFSVVLNAFRHQRMDHLLPILIFHSWVARCSTPFGINEWITKYESLLFSS